MWKLVVLLGIGMFVVLMIGGEDRGQLRQGRVGVDPATTKVLRPPQVVESPPTQEVARADVIPVTLQKPKLTGQAPVTGRFVLSGDPTDAVPAQNVAVQTGASALPVMYINASAVNVRGGPSTSHSVVGRLTRDEAVAVVAPPKDGWVQIRIEGDGVDGFVAARLLTDIDPLD
ncbi:SH3 domain-containing protein [Pseudorhodobacter aquimaris]|uniref:SH3 domain-containing protein n=1 Tax=Pseudorhodobacter aquimaris TaxID=687412 RepID=UPI00067B2C6C|nr:SH3 domain-containing protein [Pseudorhodobacter aquimaris]